MSEGSPKCHSIHRFTSLDTMITLLWTTKKESAKDITYLPSCNCVQCKIKIFSNRHSERKDMCA